MRRSRVHASLAVAAAASAASLTFAAPALAYPPSSSAAECSDSTAAPGESMQCTASGFDSGEQANEYAHSARVFVGSTTANASGVVHVSFTVPSSLSSGQHELVIVGQTSGHTATFPFTVSRASAPRTAASGGGLPFTGGSDIWQLTAAGGGLVLIGGAALFLVRRRRGLAV